MFSDKSIDIYSSRDKIRNDIIEYAKEYLELENLDFSKTSYLSYLVNILSTLTANLLFYNSATYREFFLTQAISRESIMNWASMLGYKPENATPASCQVLVEIPTQFDSDVSFNIPKGFKYYGGDITFTQDNSIFVEIIKNSSGTDILPPTVYEVQSTGGPRILKSVLSDDKSKLYFKANTTQRQFIYKEYQIPELKPYEFHTINVEFEEQLAAIYLLTTQSDQEVNIEQYINMIESGQMPESDSIYQQWEQYDSVFLIPSNIYGYAFRKTAEGGQIFFGNNIIGRQPTENDICRIAIVTTLGSSGNVIAGSITKTDRLYVDVFDLSKNRYISKVLNIRVVNDSPATGGVDIPSIDNIRSSAIATVSANNRLVSQNDYSNLAAIVDTLPIEHSIHILKRSDIKRNEITLYTDLIFEDFIVPTRNTKWDADIPIVTDSTSYIYHIRPTNTIEIDGVDYYSMFFIDVDYQNRNCAYIYYVDETEKSLSLISTSEIVTKVLPATVRLNSDFDGDPSLELEFIYNQISEDDILLSCSMITEWDGKSYNLNQVIDDTETKFVLPSKNIYLEDVPYGEKNLIFKMYQQSLGDDGTSVILAQLNESQVEVYIKEDLSDFMYSQIHVSTDTTSNMYHVSIYDVPVIKKSYYDGINQRSFSSFVYENILAFNPEEYRMATDFINLKFSNTTGLINNMLYNKETKESVISVNPITVPENPSDGDRYVITDLSYYTSGVWSGQTEPFISQYYELNHSWSKDKLTTNDIIYVDSYRQKLIFNGTHMVIPSLGIPFEIRVIVWKDTSYSVTEQALIEDIKNQLIETLYDKFGFDRNIYQSEIISIIQNVRGVDHCKVIEPNHDIFFNFDIYNDLTQSELLEYSPDFISFTSNSIYVEVRL